jgi:enolase-phosphatase E1
MIQAVLTDIEGTTSALSFVKDVLFPYARERLAAYVAHHAREAAVAQLLADARAVIGGNPNDDDVVAQMLRWIDEDRKITPLKALQGLVWEDGYRQGHFQGHVYEDAVRHLRAWHARGLRLYVYSSGSVLAQKLLFGHTAYGDLTPLFAGFFDTTIGGKREAASYRAIAASIALPAGSIVFLSDVKEELDAGRTAGMQTRWLIREGNLDASPAHRQARSFDELAF